MASARAKGGELKMFKNRYLEQMAIKYPEYRKLLEANILPEEIMDAETNAASEKLKGEKNMEQIKNENYIWGEEVITLSTGKVLDKDVSSSILCDNDLLNSCADLNKIAENGYNSYYKVLETNVCIMHVECGFCILVDDYVNIYNEPDAVSLPKMLVATKYGVYQVKGDRTYRDWIKCTKNSRPIGHDIQDMVYGNGAAIARKNGLTLDHGAETCNELISNCMYKADNFNNGSHRVCVKITNEKELKELIEKIKKYDDNGATGFFL